MADSPTADDADTNRTPEAATRFPAALVHRAAVAYYLEDRNQSEVADLLAVSRSTVSRLLAEARSSGIVEIRVREPRATDFADLEQDCAHRLGLDRVFVVPAQVLGSLGARMAAGVDRALESAGLTPGDGLLVSSGHTLYEVGQHLSFLAPGLVVAPTVGGLDEPGPWWQTNEITRVFAERLHGTPAYLHAPAMPGQRLFDSLAEDPSYLRIQALWRSARCALLGVGAPLAVRETRAAFFPTDEQVTSRSVGDVCSRFYDEDGLVVAHPGSERLVAIAPEDLFLVPERIAVAVGHDKVPSVLGGAKGGFFNQLVTDAETASALVAQSEI